VARVRAAYKGGTKYLNAKLSLQYRAAFSTVFARLETTKIGGLPYCGALSVSSFPRLFLFYPPKFKYNPLNY